MGRFRRSLTGLAAALLIACAAPGAAQAHAEVIAIDPADGSQLAQAPTVISITFSESIGVDADAIRIIDATGRQVDVAPESLAGFTLTQPLPALSDGWYLVSYRIVSADGHILHQASTFGVGAADAAARTAVLAWQSANDPLVWGARAAADLSLLIAAGVALGWALMRLRSARLQRLRRAAMATAALFGAFALVVAALDGGAAWIGGAASIGAAARVLLLTAAAVAARRTASAAPAALAVAAVATMGLGGHPGETPLGALLLLSHLGAAALWLGAAPAMLLLHSDPAVSDDDALAATRAFSRWATGAIGVVAGGGLLLGALLTEGFGGGLNDYVLLLLGKAAAVAVAIAGGAWARRRLWRASAALGLRPALRRLFALDTGILLLVVALSAALTLGSPHAGHRGHTAAIAGCRADAPLAGVALWLNPGKIGTNTLTLFGAPAAEAIRVELARPESPGALVVPLSAAAGGSWASGPGAVVLPVGGSWEATIVVNADRFSETRAGCRLQILP
jgi:copper transport protein